jgi:hypothetical protein
MFFFFQPLSFFLKESITGLEVSTNLGLAPIGIPKYLKGILSILHFNNLLAENMKDGSTLIPMRLLLKKLTFRHDTSSKPLKIVFKVLMF